MKGKRRYLNVALIVAVLLLLATSTGGALAGKPNPNPPVFPPDSKPFGKSYAEWGAEYSKWAYQIPGDRDPFQDMTGALCGDRQTGDVWYFSVGFSERSDTVLATTVREACHVPAGKAILVPVIATSCSNVEPPPFHGDTDQELLACAQASLNGPISVPENLHMMVDGVTVKNLHAYRFQSPVISTYMQNPPWWFGVDCSVADCAHVRVAAAGYWVIVEPLSPGSHTIRWISDYRDPATGMLENGWDMTYIVSVQ